VSHSSWPRQSAKFGSFYFGYFGYIGVFSPYASLYFAHRGMSVIEIGVLMALMQVMRIFGPGLWCWVADRREQRVVVLRLTGLLALASFCALASGSGFAWFFFTMAALNFFTSAQGPLAEALLLAEMRGDLTHYGRLRLWGSVGFIFSAAVGGALLDWGGVAMMPWIALALLLVVLTASLSMNEADKQTSACAPVSAAALLRRPDVIAFFVSTFLMIAAHAALYVYYSLYLAQIGYSNTLIGLMWSLGVVAEIIFFFYQAPLFRHFGVAKLMLASLFLGGVRFLLIGFGAESVVILLLAQVLHAATFGIHHSAAIATLQRWFSGPLQTRGQALYSSISYGLGGTMGALLLSPLWETFGASAVYLASALLAFASMGAAAMCYRWR